MVAYGEETIADTSAYKFCIPTDDQKNNKKNILVPTYEDANGLQKLQVTQNCEGEKSFVNNTGIRLSPCAFLIQIENQDTNPHIFEFESKEIIDSYTNYLQEHVGYGDYVMNSENKTYWLSVTDMDAQSVTIEADIIHGFAVMYLRKWDAPRYDVYDFYSSRLGRVPDVITFDQKTLLEQRPDEATRAGADGNPLVGDYFLTVVA